MDTELARTFLTVVAAGNFSAAASRLHVTQSTVSARIGALEDQLGCRLFLRSKAGTSLTPEGRWFQPHAVRLVVEPLLLETLVYVSTSEQSEALPEPAYVHVDWGPEFNSRHAAAFPSWGGARLQVNIGWLGMQHILSWGGAGYFPLRLVDEHVRAGRLFRRVDAPEFDLPAFVVYVRRGGSSRTELVVRTLLRLAEAPER